eukprot:13014920-Heterocapsa_arctica.AAC.1
MDRTQWERRRTETGWEGTGNLNNYQAVGTTNTVNGETRTSFNISNNNEITSTRKKDHGKTRRGTIPLRTAIPPWS